MTTRPAQMDSIYRWAALAHANLGIAASCEDDGDDEAAVKWIERAQVYLDRAHSRVAEMKGETHE